MSWLQRVKIKKCRSAYEAMMKEAMEAQRKGDIQAFADRTEEAAGLARAVEPPATIPAMSILPFLIASRLAIVGAMAQTTTLTPCPDTPNCVSSLAEDPVHRVKPFPLYGDATEGWEKLKTVVGEMKRVTLIEHTEEYMHAECRSALLRFVDDLEFVIRAGGRSIDVRSASRTGHSDLGVNRKRVESLRTTYVDVIRPRTKADLAAFVGHNRVLLLFTADGGEAEAAMLRQELQGRRTAVAERHLAVFECSSESKLAEELGVEPDHIQWVLVGKDGGIKRQEARLLSADEIFATIDAMPMRQREAQSQRHGQTL